MTFGDILDAFNYTVLIYFVVLNIVYFMTSLFAFRGLRRYARRLKAIELDDLVTSDNAPPITLLAPAYNEAATCVESVKAMLSLDYPDFEILVVNDGSKDATLEVLTNAYELVRAHRAPTASIPAKNIRGIYRSRKYPSVWVIDKENGGKADALNTGINYCRSPFFCAMDSDSLLERDSLKRIIRPFLENADTVAAGGVIRIVNDCRVKAGQVQEVVLPKNLWASFQVLEYLRAFLFGRLAWDAINATLIISGAFGLFRRSTVVAAGGYMTGTVAEDLELVAKLHRYCRENKIPYRVSFVPDPVAWTECPESLKILGRQRDRWQRGLCQVIWKHKRMMLNPRYGAAGMVAYPYFFLEAIGPVIEFFGYVSFIVALILGRVDFAFATAFLLAAVVLGATISLSAIGLEELSFPRYKRVRDFIKLNILSVVEAFGYRQLSLYWRIKGVLTWILGVKSWGKMERKGFRSK